MKALSFSVSFQIAHWRVHTTKKFRSSYLLIPPTAIWGMIGAILGVKREELEEFVRKNEIYVGCSLKKFEGIFWDKVTLLNLNPLDLKERQRPTSIEDVQFLINPTFDIGVAGEKLAIEKLEQKIDNYDFDYDIYGGITDCFLCEAKILTKNLELITKDKEIKGMVPVNLVKGNTLENGSRLLRIHYFNTLFYQSYLATFDTEIQMKTVDGIAVYGYEDIERFRKADIKQRIA